MKTNTICSITQQPSNPITNIEGYGIAELILSISNPIILLREMPKGQKDVFDLRFEIWNLELGTWNLELGIY